MDKWISERDKANFWSRVKRTDYCWEWSSSINSKGYGQFRAGKEIMAHRIAYQIIHGEIDESLHVLHQCDNPKCVNPDHLFTGTHADNMYDKKVKGRARKLGRSSKYIGVGFRNDSNKWRSYFKLNGKDVYIGCFKTEIEAAQAHDAKCIEHGISTDINLF